MTLHQAQRIHTIVIGGGQAGLATGYHLAQQGIPFLILDASQRIGDAWRNRWDSLRLFSPARYDALPGLPFPARGDAFPTKHEMADYLESYATKFHLPVQTGVKVDKLSKEDDRFVVSAGDLCFEAENVIVAMANYQTPRLPAFVGELDPGIRQIHSHNYRDPEQLQEGGVLVVGLGNSGADIGLEVAQSHPTWISGKETGFIPWPIEGFVGRNIMIRLVRFVGHHILSVSTPMGRRARPNLLSKAAPLIRVKPKDLVNAGAERVGRVVGARDGKPLLADGHTLEVKNVIWCTGYQPGFSWIDFPVFGADGKPLHNRGIVDEVPGLYFVGLHFLYSMTSATVNGVGRDAERIVKAISLQNRAGEKQSPGRVRAARGGLAG